MLSITINNVIANKLLQNWKKLLKSKQYLFSLALSLMIWVVGCVLYAKVIVFVDNLKGLPSVDDLLLDILPVVDLRYVYIYSIIVILVVLFVYIICRVPDLFPFSLKLFALVFIVRAIFISMTHLGPPEAFLIPAFGSEFAFWPLNNLTHSNDLFFSGHVAYPFMGALILRHDKMMFYFFLFCSFLMGVTVLLMRIHYTIDVAAAFFIVYGIYAAAKRIFGHIDLSFNKLIK